MTDREKYAIVADSILEARQAAPTSRIIKLHINRNSKLGGLFVKEVQRNTVIVYSVKGHK